MAQIGDLIGNYRLVEILGRGSFGQVFRAEHTLLAERQVAIKFLRLERLESPAERRRFSDEARILNQLKHPSILPMLDFGLDAEGVPYLITEYAPGDTLRALLKQTAGRPLDLTAALRVVIPIGEALQFAHEHGVVHSDLKPENILFDDRHRPLLADFGIAVVLTAASTAERGGGTAFYMAPEQFDGATSRKSDQYALACVLYEMLTGRRPFMAATYFALRELHLKQAPTPPRQLNPLIPEPVNTALLTALAKERAERFTSVAAFLRALTTPSLASLPVPPPDSQTPRAPQPIFFAPAPPAPRTTRQFPALDHVTGEQAASRVPSTPPPRASHRFPVSDLTVQQSPSRVPAEDDVVPPGASRQTSPTRLSLSRQTQGARTRTGSTDDMPAATSAENASVTPAPGESGEPGRSGTQSRIPPTDRRDEAGPSPDCAAANRSQRVPSGLTPLPIAPASRRTQRRRRRRIALVMLLVLVLVLVSGGLVVNALGGPANLLALGHVTATVSLTPNSHAIQNNYQFTGLTSGTPDPAQRQISAHVITAQSATEKGTANATGSIPAMKASGTLTFQNVGTTDVTIGTATLTGSDGVQIIFYGPVFVPVTGAPTVTGYAVNPGKTGNIKTLDIQGNCCAPNIFVKNLNPFTGGQDAQPNSVIQQSDIDGAVKPLVDGLTASTRADLQKQVKSNERVVDGSLRCAPTINADHRAGDVAKSVEVSVTLKCSEEVFDYAAAQRIASDLLPTNLPSNAPNLTAYRLVPPVLTGLVSASVVGGGQGQGQGQIAIQMTAAGKWVYQVSDALQRQIRQQLVRHSKTDALNILRQYVGLSAADISISSGNTMPDNPNDITLKIVPVGGLRSLPTPGAA